MYDAFISYRRKNGFGTARLLYEHLSNMGLNVFLDLEELRSGKFNEKIYSAIDDSKNFLLILPADALDGCDNEEDWLRREVVHAIKAEVNIVPVMMSGFEWPKQLPQSMQELPFFNGVHLSYEYFDACIDRLLTMLTDVKLQSGEGKVKKAEREQNKYFFFDDKKEKRRLRIQQDLMKGFDSDVYSTVAQKYDELTILDVGSNNGSFVMDRLGSNKNVKKIIGLEYDEQTVVCANQTYGSENIKFYAMNVEDDDFSLNLEELMQENNIDGFNVVNISMLLLHLKSPYTLLKAIRRVLSRDGTVIIKDIDDGFNIAYPDDNNDIARIVGICERNETSGYRKSGRQVFSLLTRAGFKNVKLEKLGLTTAGMDFEQRSALFDTYFSFIKEDLKIMTERYPADKRIANDYRWYCENYDELEEKFQTPDYFFSLGFMLFTANK